MMIAIIAWVSFDGTFKGPLVNVNVVSITITVSLLPIAPGSSRGNFTPYVMAAVVVKGP